MKVPGTEDIVVLGPTDEEIRYTVSLATVHFPLAIDTAGGDRAVAVHSKRNHVLGSPVHHVVRVVVVTVATEWHARLGQRVSHARSKVLQFWLAVRQLCEERQWPAVCGAVPAARAALIATHHAPVEAAAAREHPLLAIEDERGEDLASGVGNS